MSKKSDEKRDERGAVAAPTPTILRLFSGADAPAKQPPQQHDEDDDDPGPAAA